MIFQEPALSLNPVMPVGAQIVEVLERHTGLRGEAAAHRARELLDWVGIPDAARHLDHYPFQMSGGMKQRVMIAIALACHPSLLDRGRADHCARRDDPGPGARAAAPAAAARAACRSCSSRTTWAWWRRWRIGSPSCMPARSSRSPRASASSGRPHIRTRHKLFEACPACAGRDQPPGRDSRRRCRRSIGSSTGCRFADRCDRAWSLCRPDRCRRWSTSAADSRSAAICTPPKAAHRLRRASRRGGERGTATTMSLGRRDRSTNEARLRAACCRSKT